jgi:hypothetical protein
LPNEKLILMCKFAQKKVNLFGEKTMSMAEFTVDILFYLYLFMTKVYGLFESF